MKTRCLALMGLLMFAGCSETTAPPPPPPPPPDLLAAGEWIGDWRFLDGEVA